MLGVHFWRGSRPLQPGRVGNEITQRGRLVSALRDRAATTNVIAMTAPTPPNGPPTPPHQPAADPSVPPVTQQKPAAATQTATSPVPPAPARSQPTPPPTTEKRPHLSYRQFLGRALTASLVAPIGFLLAGLAFFGLVAGCAAALSSQPVDTGPLSVTQHVDGVDGASNRILVVDVSGTILAEGGGLGPLGGVCLLYTSPSPRDS